MARGTRRNTPLGLLFISPWLAGFLLLTLYPFAASLWWSFCRYDLLSPPVWTGPDHYRRLLDELLSGRGFGEALWNTGYYAMLSIPGSIVLGIALAALLTQPIRGQALYRTAFFLPSIVPTVASSILWMWLLDPKRGLVNRGLAVTGAQPGWFNSAQELFNPAAWFNGTAGAGAKEGLVLMSLWGLGNFLVIYMAAIQNIPRQLYEAAEIDGAGRWGRFRHVTLPSLTPVIFFNIIMGLVAAVQYFTQAYVLSGGTGGPEGSTRVLSLHVFLWAFKFQDAGYASAAAWSLFVVVALLTLLVYGSAKRWVHYN